MSNVGRFRSIPCSCSLFIQSLAVCTPSRRSWRLVTLSRRRWSLALVSSVAAPLLAQPVSSQIGGVSRPTWRSSGPATAGQVCAPFHHRARRCGPLSWYVSCHASIGHSKRPFGTSAPRAPRRCAGRIRLRQRCLFPLGSKNRAKAVAYASRLRVNRRN